MPEPSQPPPKLTLLAAAAGGFGGAVLGVVAATTLMGDADADDAQAMLDTQDTSVEVVEPKVASR